MQPRSGCRDNIDLFGRFLRFAQDWREHYTHCQRALVSPAGIFARKAVLARKDDLHFVR